MSHVSNDVSNVDVGVGSFAGPEGNRTGRARKSAKNCRIQLLVHRSFLTKAAECIEHSRSMCSCKVALHCIESTP